MNKRPPPSTASLMGGSAPPLPPGRPPTAAETAQQASISAAWATYYAQINAAQAAVSPAAPAANTAQYSNYGYGAGAAPAIQSSFPGAAAGANPAVAGYAQQQHQQQQYQVQHAPAAGVGPQAYPAYGQQQQMPMAAPQQQQHYIPQPYQQQQAPQQQPNMMLQRPPYNQQQQQQQYGQQGMMQNQQMPMHQQPMMNQSGPGWHQGSQQYNAHQATPMQGRPAPMQARPPPGQVGGFQSRPPRNNPMTPNAQVPYNAPAPFSPQGKPGGAMRPPLRPNGTPVNMNGQGFPPPKRPRVDGPPQQGNFVAPAPPRSASMSSQRGGIRPMMQHHQPAGRAGSHYAGSEYGGSQDGSVRGGSVGRGTPMGRGRGMVGRGGMAVRGGRGGAAMGHVDTRTSIRGGMIPRGGMDRGGLRGRGASFAAGKAFPAAGGRPAGAPKGPRDPRPTGRGGGPPIGSRTTASKTQMSERDREKERIREDERARAAKEEARRRTFTDFRIVGLEIKSLGWRWGQIGEDVEEIKEDSEDEEHEENDDEEEGDDSDAEESGHKRTTQEVPVPAANETKPATQSKVNGTKVKDAPTEDKPSSEAATSVKVENTPIESDADLPSDLKEVVEQADAVETATDTEEVDVTDTSKLTDEGQALSSTESGKRGEKRKAKMSSPDADDDARLTSKKRPHLTEGQDASATKSADSDKNRFRIYFDSPVAPAEPIPARAMKRKADVSDDMPREAPGPQAQAESTSESTEELTVVQIPPSEQGDDQTSQFAHADEERGSEYNLTEEMSVNEDATTGVYAEDLGDEEFVDFAASGDGEEYYHDSEHDVYEEGDPTQAQANGELEEIVLENPLQESDLEPADQPEELSSQIVEAGDETEAEAKPSAEELDISPVEATEDVHEESSDVKVESDELAIGNAEKGDQPPTAEADELTEEVEEKKGGEPITAAAEAVEAARIAEALRESAKNATAAYASSRAVKPSTAAERKAVDAKAAAFRRSPSAPPTDPDTPIPAAGRLSILYENGTRRMCLDAAVVERVRIYRKKGVIQVLMRLSTPKVTEGNIDQISRQTEEMGVSESSKKSKSKGKGKGKADATSSPADENKEVSAPTWSLMRGLLIEILDETRGLFSQVTRDALVELWKDADAVAVNAPPPLHRLDESEEENEVVQLTAYLDRSKPLSEPKWVKTGQLDEWIQSISGTSSSAHARKSNPEFSVWDGKLEVIDPDSPPTINSVLENWASRSKIGHIKARRRFINTHFSSMTNVVQILLRILRGDTKNTVSRHQLSHLHGPLATAIKPSAPYADQQTHATLAVLAVVNLTKQYAEKCGEKTQVLDNKISDIIKSLPNYLIFASVDKLYADWQAKTNKRRSY